jgi:hypothetical protein
LHGLPHLVRGPHLLEYFASRHLLLAAVAVAAPLGLPLPPTLLTAVAVAAVEFLMNFFRLFLEQRTP